VERRIEHGRKGSNVILFLRPSLSPPSSFLSSSSSLFLSPSLSPVASGRGGPPATPSSGSEPAGARRRWPEVDLDLGVEAAAAGGMGVRGRDFLIPTISPRPFSLQPHPRVGPPRGSRASLPPSSWLPMDLSQGTAAPSSVGAPVAAAGCVRARSTTENTKEEEERLILDTEKEGSVTWGPLRFSLLFLQSSSRSDSNGASLS
jgi:hypothetical protein